MDGHDERVDLAIIGGGAAGLMAAIWAARTAPGLRVVVLDGSPRLGAKILIAGGGRCNVTHDVVDETAFAGSSRFAIRKVLGRFDVGRTIAFFSEIGVPLKREATGKLFPRSDSARTVLDALLGATTAAGAEVRCGARVEGIVRTGEDFVVQGGGSVGARRVILATGGKSVPRTGSDGHGYALATALGHTLTPAIVPGLVPLRLGAEHPLVALAGVSAPATLTVQTARGKRIASFTDAVLCTHFGLSGPAILDVSRYFTLARLADPGTTLVTCWLPGETPATIAAWLTGLGAKSPGRALQARGIPERLARTLCELAAVDSSAPAARLTRAQRAAIAATVGALSLPITGDRGFTHAEVTAGGIPLAEVQLETMASRMCPGLHLCGEICDVDGRVGGYNFQWAWASGYTAGVGAARTL